VQRPKQLRSIYSVNGKVPGFTADFIKNRYPGYTSLSSAITHARAGNATMTDGYGPELVVNGSFDSDSDWTKGTGWSIADGRAVKVSGTAGYLRQDISLVEDKVYAVEWEIVSRTGGEVGPEVAGTGAFGQTQVKKYKQFIKAGSQTTGLRFYANSSFVGSIDNVSVREMPVIKWAPHNLLTYSEQFDNAAWSKLGDAPAVTANYGTAPDGTSTADRIQFDSTTSGNSTIQSPTITITNGAKYKFSVWMRSLSGNVDVTLFNVGSVTTVSVTSDWQLFTYEATSATTGSQVRIAKRDIWGTSGTADLLVWGAHLYRSDLGGMVDNPDQPLSRASYVPTTSSAKYLPRIGHHVYSSAWVNEGVLAESESRTNLITDSFDFSAWANVGTTVTSDDAVSPAGTESADAILETTATSEHYRQKSVLSLTGTYTFSVYLKAAGSTQYVILGERSTTGAQASFDLTNGAVENTSLATATIQNIGNGWYRCSLTPFSSLSNQTFGSRIQLDNNGVIDANSYAGNASNGVYAYGAQLEEGSTPSSLIPTSGSTVSRAAETFTIPSANLPWPTPQYIGSELVTNGDFSSTDISDWATQGNATLSVTNGELVVSGDGGYNDLGFYILSTTANKVYAVTITGRSITGSLRVQARLSGSPYTVLDSHTFSSTDAETVTLYFVAQASSTSLQVVQWSGVAGSGSVDNVSVREINPLAVCIGMEGRVSYADEDEVTAANFVNWVLDSNNEIRIALQTFASDVGQVNFIQDQSGYTQVEVPSAIDALSPDILVPYNIASRHGSTFINAAVDGVALTANTTPTALPDLSSTDLTLAYDYMGTISEFRVWDRDITDNGLVEATNPSLEPSLSLEFSGLGTNSFTVSDWSE